MWVGSGKLKCKMNCMNWGKDESESWRKGYEEEGKDKGEYSRIVKAKEVEKYMGIREDYDVRLWWKKSLRV